jgi:5-formyltetrahydrofolate cyclo-ligase
MTKAELRKAYLARRRAIAPDDAVQWNAAIQARVLALPELRDGGDVYIYVAADGEPETRGIIEALLGQGRRVLAPVIDRSAAQIHWGDVPGLEALRPGAYGILDPPRITQHAADPHRGIAIVPCVAFTAQGDRLGRGGGYYDRFLAIFSGVTVALAYELQRVEALPTEPHDVRVRRIVTESRTYPS